MTIEEIVIKQIVHLRACFNEYRTDAVAYANAKNDFEREEAVANSHIVHQIACNSDGEPIPLTNDIARKGYIKEKTVRFAEAMNSAKEMRDASDKKVEVEISVLSALKQIAGDENFDREILTRYDV